MGEILALASALCFGISSIFVGRAVVKAEKKERDLGVLITIFINTAISSLALAVYIILKGFIPFGLYHNRRFGGDFGGGADTHGKKLIREESGRWERVSVLPVAKSIS